MKHLRNFRHRQWSRSASRFLEMMGLDAVELVVAAEQMFGITIPNAVTTQMITPTMMIENRKQSAKLVRFLRAPIKMHPAALCSLPKSGSIL